MDVCMETVNVGFAVLLLAWVWTDFVTQRRQIRRGSTNGYLEREKIGVKDSAVFTIITVVCNVMICAINFGFGLYAYWDRRIIPCKCIFTTMTWSLATLVAFYTKNRAQREGNRWPLPLILWWVFSCMFVTLSVLLYVIGHDGSRQFSYPWPVADIVDFACLPLSVLLCFIVLAFRCKAMGNSDLEHPLLQQGNERLFNDSASFNNAGFWSQLTFGWLNPLFSVGRIQKLELSHIPSVPQSETAEYASSLLEESLGKQRTESLKLFQAIAYAIWKSLALNAAFAGINTVASYTGPLLITDFVNFLLEKPDDLSSLYGLILASIIFFSKTVESLTQRQWYFGAQRIGIRVRAALMALIYQKILSVKFNGPSNGKIINLINVDVERIGDFCWHVHAIWLLPLQVFLALMILYRNLGAAPSIAGVLSTILVMVGNTPLARKQKNLYSRIMEAKDARIKATAESLRCIRVLKLVSWESTFLEKILSLRMTEKSWLTIYLYTNSAIAFLFWTSPMLVSVITFGTCILFKTPLTTGRVLSAIATFRILQEPIYNLPELMSVLSQTKVSLNRVQEVLKEEDQREQIHSSHASRTSCIAVEMDIGQHDWEGSNDREKKPTISLSKKIKIMRGCKVAVCGSVGSGKSSLLSGIIGEIPRISGAGVKVNGTKAYVPQTPWIQTGSVRDNVLFGKDMDAALFANVLEGCALQRDILSWADGDLSVVGERGLNLSGGQKQRIQLARALYSDSDVYILDDPFSAVDAHTGNHLFKKCLMQLMSQKTVIYATHQLEFLHAADLVLVMEDGMIVQSGKFADLIADQNSELFKQMLAQKLSLTQLHCSQEENFLNNCSSNQIEASEEIFEDPANAVGHLERNEEQEIKHGRVKWGVYGTFISLAYKGALVPVILLCQVLFQALQMGSNYWIAWAAEERHNVKSVPMIRMFILLSSGSSIFILGRAVFLSSIAIETAQHLFLGMIKSVFRAPVSFFDSTSSSSILNRSSTDQSSIDTDIPYRLAGLVFALIQLLSIILLMSMVAWQMCIPFAAIIGISVWYQVYYVKTARELARMVGTRKAPVLHHFSESIAGAATIRCFNQEDRFLMKNLSLIDDYSRAVFHNLGTMEWLSVRVNLLFNVGFFLILIILVSLPKSTIDPSLAGLVATYGLNLNVLQAWIIWNLCNVENKMISVERVLQFTCIPSEAPLVIEDNKPEPEWPSYGKIELVDLYFQYSPSLPMVLKGITCTFPGGNKIGVVGRTGSGKSTLIQALFRMVEPAGGKILIDGLDISKIGLQDLRSRLGIIPQDPTLFQGTVRSNLDPLEEYTDQEIWEVLSKCQLADVVRQDQRLLDAPVAEDGENWSLGQRQLVCLARILLRKRTILVLDEATASVDVATDNIIQKTIREETGRCTIIAVAHRIPTIVDSDRVLVLDEGKVVEYDSPVKLLEDNSSSFSKLVAEFLRRSSNSMRREDVS